MRIFLSILAVLFSWGMANFGDSTQAVVNGKLLGAQMAPSDSSYIFMETALGWSHTIHSLAAFFLPLALIAIWWGAIKKLMNSAAILAIASPMVFLAFGHPAHAYYADSDYAETFMILPNESAFWLPDVGDNKNGQVAFGSIDYYKANKIAAKRFDVTTHVRLPNSGIFANKYVSPGRLIKVDRAPVARVWVAGEHRGTSKLDEGMPCQSSEGHDIKVGISIGAFVTEEDAPKFLYNFGVNTPKGNPEDPNVVFTSVYYGKSLAQVMDEKVHPRVQSLVCDEMTRHPLDYDNEHAAEIMSDIEKKVTDYMAKRGITLDFIGWADTFDFDPKIQDAIDRKFIAVKDADIAKITAPNLDTLQRQANIEATRTLASKWSGNFPNTVQVWWLPNSITDWLTGWFSSGKPEPAKPAAAK